MQTIESQICNEMERPCAKKVCLVTGSSTGIGASIAVELASNGYIVIITGRNLESMKKTVQLCNESARCEGTVAFAFQADLFDINQVDSLITFIRIKFCRLDVLVNNACWRGEMTSKIDSGTYDDFVKVMHMNVSVPMYLISKCLIPLASSERTISNESQPIIINISSIAGRNVVPLHFYSISKACLTELTNQVSAMTKDRNLRVVTISPGPVLTDERPHHQQMSSLTLTRRVGTPKEISDLLMFVIKKIHIFHGKELIIDGGYEVKDRYS